MRKKPKVIRSAHDALEQLTGVEKAQLKSRKRKKKDEIASIEKSRHRAKNWLKEIKTRDDADREFKQ